jgi:serine/threonine-protein kinase
MIGPYRVVQSLGEGGMGEVLLAHDDRLDRRVAIKQIRADERSDEGYRKRLVQEARATARLHHPSVVQVFDIIEEGDSHAIVMEYVDGQNLAEALKEGALDARRLTDVLLQVTDGLQAAHQAGLVHRDLKGENVLVSADGTAKILDFGIATFLQPSDADVRLTGKGVGLGTVRAMSPEQSEGGDVDARSDLFSFGVLLYEALTGRSPFLGRTKVSTLTRVVTHDPPPPSQLNHSVPDALADLTLALLAKSPLERPESAGTVAAVLEAVRDSEELSGMVIPRLRYEPTVGAESTSPSGDPSESRRRARDRARSRHGTDTDVVRRPQRRLWVGAGIVFAAFVVGAVTSQLWLIRTPDPSMGRIMVYPLVGGAGVPATVGEDVATMIGHALDGAQPLTWVDGWSALDAASRSDIRSLELDRAAEVARSAGCGYFVVGRVVIAEGSTRVFLDLRDAWSGDRVSGGEAASAAEEPWKAGLGAMSALLPTLLPTDVPDLAADFTSVAPVSVALFLRGEAAHRRAQVGESRELFRASFAADSTFALAGIRGAQAASWRHDHEGARDLLEAVLRLPLQPTAESFARGILAYVDFDAERAIQHLESALERDSSLTVAWAALGEVYRHRAPRDPWPGGLGPFERAMAQDSLAGYVLFHRLEELIRAGDTVSASVLRERFRAGGPDEHLLDQIDVMYECVVRGPGSADWTEAARRAGPAVSFGAGQLLIQGRQLPCAEALYRAVMIADTTTTSAEGRYWSGFLGLTGSKLAQGRFDEARRLIVAASEGFETFQSLVDRSVVTRDGVVLPDDDAPWVPRDVPLRSIWEGSLTRWSELAILVSAVYPELVDLGEFGAADIRPEADYSVIPYRTSAWMLGLWDARADRPAEAARAAERLLEFAAEMDDPVEEAYTRRMADALAAHRFLAGGDTSSALAVLRDLKASANEGTVFVELIGSFALERLVLAQLEEELGDPERALTLMGGFDQPSAVTNALYLPVALEACVRLATRLSQGTRAQECRSRAAALGF